MLGADKVCRSWRRAARDVPELWRRIDMRGYEKLSHRNLADLNQMAVDAVLRCQGQCQAFMGDRASVTDGVLRFLAHRAPSLKSLILISCDEKASAEVFSEAIQMFPQLEELELTECLYLDHEGLFDVVSKACPRLKHMRHSHTSYTYCACCPLPAGDDREAMGIATMHEIRSLRLVHNNLTNQGLTAILDNCRHLESLEIRNCCNIVIDDALRAKCAHIKSLKLVWYIGDEYCEDDYQPSPISECFTCLDYFKNCTTEQYRNGRQTTTDNNGEKHMVVAIVHKIRSLEFYRNDLTSQGVAAILEEFPQLELFDKHNCRNIIMNNAITMSNIFQGNIRHPWRWITAKTKKLTTKLLRDKINSDEFDPESLARVFSDINMSTAFGSKYTPTILRKKIKNYRRKARQRAKGRKFDHDELEDDRSTVECSNCRMFEYFAKSWEELDTDDYSDYYDPWYGFDSHDEIDLHVHDVMVGKMLRRYLKMEPK